MHSDETSTSIHFVKVACSSLLLLGCLEYDQVPCSAVTMHCMAMSAKRKTRVLLFNTNNVSVNSLPKFEFAFSHIVAIAFTLQQANYPCSAAIDKVSRS